MTLLLHGTLQSGKGDASHWLRKFNREYAVKLGAPLFSGSLNIALPEPFDWFASHIQAQVVRFERHEYGGERDILLLPCRLHDLDNRAAHLWSTTTAATDRPDRHVVEVICDVGLRSTYGLVNGDRIAIALPGSR